jgi:hypothetical protein
MMTSTALQVAIDTSDIKNGLTIELDGEPYKVCGKELALSCRQVESAICHLGMKSYKYVYLPLVSMLYYDDAICLGFGLFHHEASSWRGQDDH